MRWLKMMKRLLLLLLYLLLLVLEQWLPLLQLLEVAGCVVRW